jgi:hypothetical protein
MLRKAKDISMGTGLSDDFVRSEIFSENFGVGLVV